MALTKCLPFQKEGLEKIKEFNGRALLADDMGLGKTFQFIRYTHRMNLFPAIVICPASVKFNWEIEILEHAGLRSEVLCGRKPHRRDGLQTKPPPFTIINYDILDAWLEYLVSLDAKIMGIDESQYLGNHKSKRTRMVLDLCKGGRTYTGAERRKLQKKPPRRKSIPNVIAMSGTPFENRPIELFSTLRLVAPSLFPSRLTYGERYCGPTVEFGKRQYKGASNLKELNGILLENCMIRRRKKDVLEQLPDKSRTVVPLEITGKREYQKAENRFKGWLKDVLPEQRKTARLKRFGDLKRLAAMGKQREVIKWIDQFLSMNDKLVVFGIHKKMLTPIYEKYEKEAVLITGKVTGRDRQNAITDFVQNPKRRLVVGNLKAAGVGINGLQKVCDTAAFIEYGWNPASHAQAEDRLWRIGQTRGVRIYYLTAKDTIEHRICQLIQVKNGWFNEAFNSDVQTEELNLMDMLENELRTDTH